MKRLPFRNLADEAVSPTAWYLALLACCAVLLAVAYART